MTKSKLCLAFAAAFLLLWVAPHSFAETLNLRSGGNNILDANYVGPYTATVNGVSTLILCDDYADDVYLGETWTANVSTYPSLTHVQYAQGQSNQAQLYSEAGWLAQQVFSGKYSSSQVGELQYALWGLFDPQALMDLSNDGYSTQASAANAYLSDAETADFSSVNFSRFEIYTPNNGVNSCLGGSCSTGTPPQEFITYATPEPSLVIILLADLLLFGAAIVILRRRGIILGFN